jgi:hypothetical protein
MENETTEQPVEVKKIPDMFFTVTIVNKSQKPVHLLVKAESAIQALATVQNVEKAPVIAVHITEYSKYLDATVSEESKVIS